MAKIFLTFIFAISILISSNNTLKAQENAMNEQEMENMDIVVLRTIDKISAYTNTFEIPVNKTVQFGASLFIKARACRKALPIEKPEDAAFLQIWEKQPDEQKPNWVFSGWMFSSNPSISAMDHPVYDVWVISCKTERTITSEEVFSTEASPDEQEASPDEQEASPVKDEEAEESSNNVEREYLND